MTAIHNKNDLITPHFFRASKWSIKGLWVIAEVEMRAILNNRATLFGRVVIEPLVYTSFLVAGLQGVISDSSFEFMSFAFPGILAVHTIRAFAGAIYRATVDRRWGLLGLKILSGVGGLGYVLGFSIIPILVFIAQSIIIAIVATALGASFSFSQYVLTIFIGIFMILFWVCLALLITTSVKNYRQRDMIISFSMLPITFSAPIFYSIESLPLYMKIVSYLNPLTYQVLAMRAATLGHTILQPFLIVLFLSAVLIFLSIYTLNWAELLSTEH